MRRNWISSVLNVARYDATALKSLVEARRRSLLVGVTWVQMMPGRVANVWAPRLITEEPVHTADRVLAWADEFLRQDGIAVAQSLLRSTMDSDAQLLARHSYRFAAELLYLVYDVTELAGMPHTGEVTFESYREADRHRLTQVIADTYRDTLDIPAMNGLRSLEDVVDGYAHTRVGDANHWFLLVRGGVDVGCLLLADHSDADQLELVYMGLVPAARGRGWGAEAARFTQRAALNARRSRVVLAVDAANEPALETYRRVGFFEWDRRCVFLRPLP